MSLRDTYNIRIFSALFLVGLLFVVASLSAQTTITVPSSGTQSFTLQPGQSYTVLDPGGNYNYPYSCSGKVILTAANGSPIHLTGSFNVENNYDRIFIIEGEQTIAQYTGTGSVDVYCYSGTMTIMFTSDASINKSGFVFTAQTCEVNSNWMQNVNSVATDTSVVISWTDPQNPSYWTVRYGETPANLNHSVTATQSQITLNNLSAGTLYYYRIFRNNGNSTTPCYTRTYSVYTPCLTSSACVDHADFSSCRVSATYGSFSNPTANEGFVDMGSGSASSRHTVHTNLTEYDSRTGNQLKTVPPGFTSSVRLGNWQTGAKAERITYQYTVDTLNSDLFIMKYAAVMQNPNHTASHQPRFTFRILNANGNEVNSSCYSADFVSSVSLGWNSYGSNILWKDWTTVGIDLTPLQGQTIFIELTTYDCSESGHYGYAYFVFDCTFKNMSSTNCGNVVENTFTAPDGFAYRWYDVQSPSVTLSNSQNLHVTQAGEYHCLMQFVGAPAGASCSCELTAIAGERYPTAQFTWQEEDVDNCSGAVQFYNNSVISVDSAHQNLTTLPCEGAFWIFDDGTTSTELNPHHTFAPGNHSVTLVASLSNGACTDTLTQVVPVALPCLVFDTIRATICEGDSYHFFDTVVSNPGIYYHDSVNVHKILILSLLSTSSLVIDTAVVENALPFVVGGQSFWKDTNDFSITLVNHNGCDSIISGSLHVWRNVTAEADSTLCEDALPLQWNGVSFTTDDTVTRNLAAVGIHAMHGEDSTLTMRVHVLRNSTYTQRDTVIENNLPVAFCGMSFTAGVVDTTFVIANAAGCDSTITYSLHVWHNVTAEADSTLCEDALPLQWNGVSFTTDDTVTRNLATVGIHAMHGEDSTLTMRVHVLRNSTYTQRDTVIENSLPVAFCGVNFTTGVVDTTFVIANTAGCDSIVHYSLHVWHNVSSVVDSTLCENALPIVWNGVTFTLASVGGQPMEVEPALLAGAGQHGVDSTVTMRLTVLRNTTMERHDTIVENALPVAVGGITFGDSHADSVWTIVNTVGCDSTITYSLHVWHNVTAEVDSTLCEDALPLQWNGVSFTTDDTVTRNMATVGIHAMHGEDSTLTMRVHVLRNSTYTQRDTVIENNLPVAFCGVSFTTGVVDTTFVIANDAGCDSIVHYSLHVWNNVSSVVDSTLCENALPIVWNGVTFTLASVGSQPMEVEPALLAGAGQHGVDSTVTMRLTVLRNTTMERHDTIVENALPVTVGGVTFGDSHADSVWTIANAAGCDSTITYSLHVWHNVTAEADSTLCEDALPLLWNGVSFTTDDTVTRNLATVGIHAIHGEDSTLTMRVHVLRNSTYTQRDTVIENNLPVAFCGVNFTTGVVDTTFVIANDAGCDSIVHYSLHVWRNYHHLFDSTVCDNQLPLTWCGADYSADLTDYQTLSPSTLQQSQTQEYTSVHGADSTVTLVLTVHRTYEVNDAADICDGDTLYVAGTQGLLPLTEGGNYPVPLQSIHHCDSLVHLALTVHPVYLTAWFDTICDNQETTFDGQTVVVGGHYEVHHRTVAGCDSTLKMDLTVWNTDFLFDHHSTCHGISYIWENGVEYFTSTYEPTVTYANQHGCDSTRRLILDIDTSFQALVQATPMTVTYEHHNVRLADVSGGTSRIWYFPYITDTSQVTHYDYPMDQDSVEIMLVAVNWLGCVDSSVVVLRADRGILWPPNVFTPNESTNQVFFIPSYELASGEVWIYSRQGNLVAHFDALTGSWDGKKNGVLCPQASYMWVMRYTTKANPRQEQTAKGTVTLLK